MTATGLRTHRCCSLSRDQVGNSVRLGPPRCASDQVTWNSVLSTSLGIGLFEEIPFRGFILQQFAERMNFWLANLLTSVVFLGMHLPGWLSLQVNAGSQTIQELGLLHEEGLVSSSRSAFLPKV
jgi:membrane protease YdiL (CAAX protease family)